MQSSHEQINMLLRLETSRYQVIDMIILDKHL